MIKEPTDESTGLTSEEWKLLNDNIQEYNKYVDERVRLIMDFDIWYESTHACEFPKKWYSMVRESAYHK